MGARRALVVGAGTYLHPGLRPLEAPITDADDLVRVLGDPEIGGFDVESLLDDDAAAIRRRLESFFTSGVAHDDLLLVYVAAELTVLGAITVVQAIVLFLTATARQAAFGPGAALSSAWLELLIIVVASALGAMTMGLALSSLVSTTSRAVALLPLLLIPQLLLCGALLDVDAQPGLAQASHAMVSRYGFYASAATVDLNRLEFCHDDTLDAIIRARFLGVEPDCSPGRFTADSGRWLANLAGLAIFGGIMVTITVFAVGREPGRARRRRAGRRAAATIATLCVAALLLAACGSDSAPESAVPIGPGNDDPPPTTSANDAGEPGWTSSVPTTVASATPLGVRAQALEQTGSIGLAPPPTKRPPRTTTTGPRRTTTTRPAARFDGDFSGTMTIDVAYYDYCRTYDGTLAFAGGATYEMAAEVFFNKRIDHEGVKERSPFNLIVASENGVEASTMMQSASLVTDTRDGKSAVFDSWDIDATGNSFAGDLVDRWPGFVYNQITTSQLFVPCRPELGGMALADQLATGTHVEGALDGDRLTLTLVGQSFDTEVRFRATLEAERVEG